jgi:hypothetical protein
VWQRTTYDTGPDGEVVTNTHSYTELSTGLNYWKKGEWVDSKEEINIAPKGGAEAVQGQHQMYFPSVIYSGVLEIVTPDGTRLKSRPIGISYFDGTNSVLIAELTNSVGQIISANQVIYTNAFTDFPADLVVTYRKSGVECDLVFRSQIPEPELFGMDSANPGTRLELLTEFFNTRAPEVTPMMTSPDSGLQDNTLTFGSMRMVQGRVFHVGTGGKPSGPAPGAEVSKTWLPDIDGRTVLVEELPYKSISQALRILSSSSARATNSPKSVPNKVSASRLLPARRAAQASTNTIRLATAEVTAKPGVVMDYTLVVSQTNMTFRGDMTYYVSGAVNLYGTNYVEGGTVLKYTNNASVNLYSGALNLANAAYNPAIFTSKDDNTVGETLPGSTGNPANYYANPALNFPGSPTTNVISGFRIAWAAQAINTFAPLICRDAQLVNCQSGITSQYRPLYALNMLFANVKTNFTVLNQGVTAQNATFSGSSCLAQFIGGAGVGLNNCILANVTNLVGGYPGQQITGDDNGFYNSPAFGTTQITNTFYPFQTVGSGSYYLTNGTAFADSGTTNIDATLLAELPKKTTAPPIVYTSTTITTNLELGPRAIRDTNAPDLGFHYDPLDWCFGRVQVNSNITFDAGTAVGWFEIQGGNDWGLTLNNNSTNRFNGTLTSPCVFAHYDTVQEGNGAWPNHGWLGGVTTLYNSSYFAEIDAKFLHCFAFAGSANHFRDFLARLDVHANHTEFYSGNITGYWLGTFMTNCLYNRCPVGSQQKSDGIYWRNCTMHGGFVFALHSSNPYWPVWIENCAFDGSTIQMDDHSGGNTNITYCNYNAFLNGASRLTMLGANDIVTNTFTWQTGPLGVYYQATNSSLIDAGSVTADVVGLYHFTTQTNQAIEGTSPVDIGYHYVALDSSGNPIDTNGDGIPDYLEDANGNGIFDSGDIADWERYGLNNANGLLIFTPLK